MGRPAAVGAVSVEYSKSVIRMLGKGTSWPKTVSVGTGHHQANGLRNGRATNAHWEFGPCGVRWINPTKPSDYLDRNCWFAASVMGPIEVERRYDIGVGNLMWGDDFPHPEGSWPHTREWIQDRFGDVPEADSRRILGLNAAELYRFDLEKLAPVVERIGSTREDICGKAAR